MIPEKPRYISSISDIDTQTKLLIEGDITAQQDEYFYDATYYFKSSLAYIQGKFLLNDPLICNAYWVGERSIFLSCSQV